MVSLQVISIKHVIRQAAWSGEICFNSQRGMSKSFSMWPQFASLMMPAGRSIVFGLDTITTAVAQVPRQSKFHLNSSATEKVLKHY